MGQNALELYKRIKSEYDATRQPIKERAFLAPLGVYEDGSVHAAWPGFIAEPAQSWVNMVDRARSGVEDDQAMARDAFNVGGAVGLSSLAATPLKPANALSAMGKGIRAYHGSPYDFDKFDLSKIGTGEGAQAYGHGLYFAEHPTTARSYQVSIPAFKELPMESTINGKNINWDDPVEVAAFEATRHSGDREAAAKFFEQNFRKDSKVPSILRSDAQLPEVKLPGYLYEVNVNAEPEQFLDWDKPLIQQNENVRKAFIKAQNQNDPILSELIDTSPESLLMQGIMPNAKGSAVYETLVDDHKFPENASKKLLDSGIPGIKFLDQGSRHLNSGKGSHNYVIFDDKLIDILRKYGILAPVAGNAVYNALETEQPQTNY